MSDFIDENENILLVPNLYQFMANNLASNDKILLTNLKLEVNNLIEFFKTQFIKNDDIINKINMMLSIGYEHIFKINSYLNILFLKDERVCNKNLYEQCLNSNIVISSYMNRLTEMLNDDNNLEIDIMNNTTKIIKNLENVKENIFNDAINEIFSIKRNNNKLTQINIFNNNINNYILNMYMIKEILSKA
jgi:hypothetical protein